MGLHSLDNRTAQELFCKIFAKYKKRKVSELFTSMNDVNDALNDAKRKVTYISIQEDINKNVKTQGNGSFDTLTGKRIYEFANYIRKKREVMLNPKVLDVFEFYINEKGTYSNLISKETDNEMINKLIGTTWFVYHRFEYIDVGVNQEKKTVGGIIRGVLHFKLFGKVEGFSIEPKGNKENRIQYHGNYTFYSKSNSLLHCEIFEKGSDSPTYITCYLGGKTKKVSVGQFHSTIPKNGSLYGGALIFDPNIPPNDESLKPAFFNEEEKEDMGKIPHHVQLFLTKNALVETPTIYTELNDLKNWALERLNQTGNNITVASSDKLGFIPNESKIKTFRTKFYFYYSTKSNRKEEQKGKGILFWNHLIFDFSIPHEKGKLKCVSKVFNRKRDNKYPDYNVEMIRTFDLDPVIIIERRKDSEEGLTVCVLPPMPVSYDPINYGFCFHDDWSNKLRLSPLILSTKSLFGVKKIGPMTHVQSIKAQKKWNTDFLKNNKDYTIFEQYK